MMHILDVLWEYIRDEPYIRYLDRLSGPPPKPSIKEPLKVDLKPLPPYLHYAYLDSYNTLLMIVSSDLCEL